MLTAIVRWTLQRPGLIAAAAVLLLVYGALVLTQAKYDVFPDFVPAEAEVQTEAPGLAAEQVEELVTRPVEQAVAGAAGVAAVRSETIAGLSVVKVVFEDGFDPYRARQIVSETLGGAHAQMPAGVGAPMVTPLTSSTMDLLKVGFTSDKLTPLELRDVVEWTIRPQVMAIPGVARAIIYGGEIRRIEVQADPAALALHGLGFSDLTEAVSVSTGVAGAGFIDTPQQRIQVMPSAQASGPEQIAAAIIPGRTGPPLRIGDVARVVYAPGPEIGDALIMDKQGVLLSISSQYGANTLEATQRVEAALAAVKPALDAQGVTMLSGIHRPATFITTALHGITEDLLIGMAFIALILFLFMRDLRTVLVSFVSIPLSLLAAIVALDALGWTVNTMTLGGLAVALGVVVDDAVIDVENIVRRLRVAEGREPAILTVLKASVEVREPVIYATLVLIITLAPVFFLHGLQGKFFAPLAAAFIIATLASLFVAIVVTPALSLLLLSRSKPRDEPRLLTAGKSWHERALTRAAAWPWVGVVATVAALVVSIAGLASMRSQFLPAFREGHFVIALNANPGTSLDVARQYGLSITRELMAIKGVDKIEQQLGRAPGGEDTWGTEQSEFHIELAPNLSGGQQDRIAGQIQAITDKYPGLAAEHLTFLSDRIGESFSGETAALVVGVYGADLDTLDQAAAQVAAVMRGVPGARDVRIQTPAEAPMVRVDFDFVRLSQNNLTPREAMATVAAVFQGEATAQVYQDNRTLDVAVTAPAGLRQDPEAIGGLPIRNAEGRLVPLRAVAEVYLTDGRTSISHEGGRRRQAVTANPPPAEVESVTRATQQAIASRVKLPPGVYLEFAGAAKAAAEARRELLFNSLLAAAAMVGVLLVAFRSGRSVALVLASAPFALIGGVAAVALTGATLSLGSLVGFITLFGVAARNAILLISHVDHVVDEEGLPWSLEAVLQATRERVTPILMTALVTALGLAPLAFQTGQTGREIQGPMAQVILGGLITSTLMSLILLPPLIWRFGRGTAGSAIGDRNGGKPNAG